MPRGVCADHLTIVDPILQETGYYCPTTSVSSLDLRPAINDIPLMLKRTISILCGLLALTLFAGCVTEQLDSEGNVIKKKRADNPVRGETGAYYARN